MLEFKCSLLHMVKEIVLSKHKVYVANGFIDLMNMKAKNILFCHI